MRRWFVPWSGLVVAMLTVLALVGATVPAEARAKRAATSFVYVESDPGDVTGHGLTYLAAQPTATVQVLGSKKSSHLLVQAEDHGHSFTFWIDRESDRVTTGVHEFGAGNPSGYELAAALPRGEGGTLEGSMDVRQLEFSKDGSRVTRLDVTFEAYDTGYGTGGSRGHLAYRLTRSAEPASTPAVLHGGEWIRYQRELVNLQGPTGGTATNDTAQRLTLGGGKAVLLRRDWRDPLHPEKYVDEVAWTTPTGGSPADRLNLSKTGRLSLRAGDDKTVWSVRPEGAGKGTFLLVNYDGRLLLVSPRFKVLWSAG